MNKFVSDFFLCKIIKLIMFDYVCKAKNKLHLKKIILEHMTNTKNCVK